MLSVLTIECCPLYWSLKDYFFLINVGSITAQTSAGGQVALVQGTDVQEYSYQLQGSYSSRPGVAIAVNSFNAQSSSDLFFSVKPIIGSNNFNNLTFVVKTNWCKTTWTKIQFNFLV